MFENLYDFDAYVNEVVNDSFKEDYNSNNSSYNHQDDLDEKDKK